MGRVTGGGDRAAVAAHRAAPRTIGVALARRIALDAQGFGARHRPRAAVTSAHLRRTAERLGVVQIDSVNVVARSHYLPFLARLGPYDPARLDRLRDDGRHRRLVEYWAHEASLVPLETWPLLGFRMRRAEAEAWSGMRSVARERPELVAAVLAHVVERGPVTARELEAALGADGPRAREQWGWNWSAVKHALEHLFWSGLVTSAGRTAQFQRRYASPAAVLPPEIVARGPHGADPIGEQEALTRLVAIAARAHGIGTAACLRDYFRLSAAQTGAAIERLVADGTLEPVTVRGWSRPAYLHEEARLPRRVRARALLSPFDSLVWQRDRARALFDFDFRLEIYVPAARRVHGYYVLPFLLDEALVGRVDVKADRREGLLRPLAVHWEPGALARRPDAPDELEAALAELAAFLALPGVAPAGATGTTDPLSAG